MGHQRERELQQSWQAGNRATENYVRGKREGYQAAREQMRKIIEEMPTCHYGADMKTAIIACLSNASDQEREHKTL